MSKYVSFFAVFASVATLVLFVMTEVFGIREILPPAYDPYINDYVNIINTQDEQALREILKDIHQKHALHINVATITSAQSYVLMGNGSMDAVAYHLYQNWKSSENNRDLDALILIAATTRQIRIEFGGSRGGKYNLEMTQIIAESMAPAFRNHRYSYGILKGIRDIVKTLTGADIAADPVMADDLDGCNIWGQMLGIVKAPPKAAAGFMWWCLLISVFVINVMNGGFIGSGGGGGGSDGGGGSGGDGGGGGGGGGGSGDGGGGGW